MIILFQLQVESSLRITTSVVRDVEARDVNVNAKRDVDVILDVDVEVDIGAANIYQCKDQGIHKLTNRWWHWQRMVPTNSRTNWHNTSGDSIARKNLI